MLNNLSRHVRIILAKGEKIMNLLLIPNFQRNSQMPVKTACKILVAVNLKHILICQNRSYQRSQVMMISLLKLGIKIK